MKWQDKVKKLMEIQGINQKKLSQKSGITEASVSRYLNGERTARMDIIINFSKALNVNVEYLLDEDEEKNIDPFTDIATVIARNGKGLSADEKNKLIKLILNMED